MSKKQKTFMWLVAVLLLCAATIPAAIWVTHTQTAEVGNGRARCQRVDGRMHEVTIRNGAVTPAVTIADKCDRLAIINLDGRQRLMAFGPHDNHVSYDGVSEKLLSTGDRLEITLIRTGTFTFHDHEQEDVAGSFIVR